MQRPTKMSPSELFGPFPLPPKIEDADPLLSVGGSVDRTSASLRFLDDHLDPDHLTALLGCPPTRASRKGDILPSKRSHRVARTGSWHLQTPKDDPRPLDAQIAGLLDSVTSDPAAWQQLAACATADIFCGLFLKDWNRGFSLSPALLQRLAERHLQLEFDIYCSADNSSEPSDK